jgi:uncharacterized protein YrrD
MKIPINARVTCKDEHCGHSTCVILDPRSERVTHVIVRERGLAGLEHLVPVDKIRSSTENGITLGCSFKELQSMKEFISTEFMQLDSPFLTYLSGEYMLWPYMVADNRTITFHREQVPAGELVIHNGTAVYAQDGKIGQVDEFIFESDDDHITHLVLREGHLWGKKEIAIPVESIQSIQEDAVILKMTKKSIEKLPALNASA